MTTTTRMDPVIKERWATALESGEYKQGTGGLRDADSDTYCCLGVLCELAVEDGIIERRLRKGFRQSPEWVYGYPGESAFLPPEVTKWAGLDQPGGRFSGNSPTVNGTELVELNDNQYRDFPYIAQQIRQWL